jgi:hypothetical protein
MMGPNTKHKMSYRSSPFVLALASLVPRLILSIGTVEPVERFDQR